MSTPEAAKEAAEPTATPGAAAPAERPSTAESDAEMAIRVMGDIMYELASMPPDEHILYVQRRLAPLAISKAAKTALFAYYCTGVRTGEMARTAHMDQQPKKLAINNDGITAEGMDSKDMADAISNHMRIKTGDNVVAGPVNGGQVQAILRDLPPKPPPPPPPAPNPIRMKFKESMVAIPAAIIIAASVAAIAIGKDWLVAPRAKPAMATPALSAIAVAVAGTGARIWLTPNPQPMAPAGVVTASATAKP